MLLLLFWTNCCLFNYLKIRNKTIFISSFLPSSMLFLSFYRFSSLTALIFQSSFPPFIWKSRDLLLILFSPTSLFPDDPISVCSFNSNLNDEVSSVLVSWVFDILWTPQYQCLQTEFIFVNPPFLSHNCPHPPFFSHWCDTHLASLSSLLRLNDSATLSTHLLKPKTCV